MDHPFEIVTQRELELAGLETRASNDNLEKIGDLWARFFRDELMQRIKPQDDGIVAVYSEYEGDHTQPYTFFLGRRLALDATVPEGLARRSLPGGTFARFAAEGEQPQALMATWQAIWEAPIVRRFEIDYEFHSPADPSRIEVYVGIDA